MHGITSKTIALASTCMVFVGLTTSSQVTKGDLSIFSLENNIMELSLAMSPGESSSKEERILRIFRRAEAYETSGSFEKAMDCYKEVIEASYSEDFTWQARQCRASILERQDKQAQAINEYTGYIDSARPGILKSLAVSYRAELYEKIGLDDQAQLDRDVLASMR